MLRSQAANLTFAAIARVEAGPEYILPRGSVFLLSLKKRDPKTPIGGSICPIAFLSTKKTGYQVEQKACVNNWLNGSLD